jgi:hypothetical protein
VIADVDDVERGAELCGAFQFDGEAFAGLCVDVFVGRGEVDEIGRVDDEREDVVGFEIGAVLFDEGGIEGLLFPPRGLPQKIWRARAPISLARCGPVENERCIPKRMELNP